MGIRKKRCGKPMVSRSETETNGGLYPGYVDVFADCWLSTWESNCKKHRVFGMGRLFKKTQKWLAGRILLNHRNEMLVHIFGWGLKTKARFPWFQKSEVSPCFSLSRDFMGSKCSGQKEHLLTTIYIWRENSEICRNSRGRKRHWDNLVFLSWWLVTG